MKALVFDVFGTVVDWRGSIAREVEALAKQKGFSVDGARFADAWRAEYAPSMNRVRPPEGPSPAIPAEDTCMVTCATVDVRSSGQTLPCGSTWASDRRIFNLVLASHGNMSRVAQPIGEDSIRRARVKYKQASVFQHA